MSIRHKVKDRGVNGKIRPLFFGWDYRWHDEHTWIFVDYNKNPGWWDNFYNNKPKRCQANNLCKKIVSGAVDPDAAIFPLEKKPKFYYW